MPISELKTNAWQSKETAERYHAGTVGAHRLFQIIRHELFLRYIERYVNRGRKVLDLGSGSGLLSVALSDLGYEVVASDVSQAMLDKLESEKGNRNIEMRLGSGFKIPALNEEFDAVISRMFLQHFPDWLAILKEKARVTRPGGIVLFDFGNREHVAAASNPRITAEFPYDAETDVATKYYAVATEEEMRQAASESGLSVVAIIPHGMMLNNAHLWNAIGGQGVEEFYSKLDRLLGNEQARQLLLFIEESFVSLAPKHLTYGNVTVLRKIPSS